MCNGRRGLHDGDVGCRCSRWCREQEWAEQQIEGVRHRPRRRCADRRAARPVPRHRGRGRSTTAPRPMDVSVHRRMGRRPGTARVHDHRSPQCGVRPAVSSGAPDLAPQHTHLFRAAPPGTGDGSVPLRPGAGRARRPRPVGANLQCRCRVHPGRLHTPNLPARRLEPPAVHRRDSTPSSSTGRRGQFPERHRPDSRRHRTPIPPHTPDHLGSDADRRRPRCTDRGDRRRLTMVHGRRG